MQKWKQEFILKQRKNKKSIHKKAIKNIFREGSEQPLIYQRNKMKIYLKLVIKKKVEIGPIILIKNNNKF